MDDPFLFFIEALRSGQWDELKSSLANFSSPDMVIDKDTGNDAVSLSIKLGHLSGVSFLFEQGASINALDKNGRPLVLRVVRYAKMFSFLSKEPPRITDCFTPCQPSDLLVSLYARGMSLSALDKNGFSALVLAKSWGLSEFALVLEKLLLSDGKGDLSERNVRTL